MSIWIVIMGLTMILFCVGIGYLVTRINRFNIIKKIEKNKALKIFVPIIILLIFILGLKIFFSTINLIIIVLHYLIIWFIIDIAFKIIEKIKKKEFKMYYAGGATLVIVPIYLCIGWYYAHHVYETKYNFDSEKITNKLRIVQFSDSHLGATFDSEGFKVELKKIQDTKPDIILLTGDFVDDGTTKEDMINSCKYLGEVKTKYGIYFAYGNHDKGYYGSEYRGFSKSELEDELKKNKIRILEDESILINDEFYIIGRKDFEEKNRKSIDSLTKDLDKNKYMIVMDHQPTDYENESNSKVDLVLSGHTHGGQLIPIIALNKLFSENCRVYGCEKRDNTNFIVSSGISDWEIIFKTGCISEYVVIDIN